MVYHSFTLHKRFTSLIANILILFSGVVVTPGVPGLCVKVTAVAVSVTAVAVGREWEYYVSDSSDTARFLFCFQRVACDTNRVTLCDTKIFGVGRASPDMSGDRNSDRVTRVVTRFVTRDTVCDTKIFRVCVGVRTARGNYHAYSGNYH